MRIASRLLGWKYSRTRSVWYADERVSLKPREVREVEEISGVKYVAEGRAERGGVDSLIAKADALLMGSDPDFASAFVTAFRAFAGALDRAGAGRKSGGDK